MTLLILAVFAVALLTVLAIAALYYQVQLAQRLDDHGLQLDMLVMRHNEERAEWCDERRELIDKLLDGCAATPSRIHREKLAETEAGRQVAETRAFVETGHVPPQYAGTEQPRARARAPSREKLAQAAADAEAAGISLGS